MIGTLALVPGKIYLPQILEVACTKTTLWIRAEPPRPLRRRLYSTFIQMLTMLFVKGVRRVVERLDLEPLCKTNSEAGVGLLAASSWMYDEGHVLYWGLNVFYLPRGPVNHAIYYMHNIQLKHKNLIRRVAIQLTLADLTPPVITHLEDYIIEDPDGPWRFAYPLPRNFAHHEWADHTSTLLDFLWAEKLAWVRCWTGLQELHLEAFDEPPLVLQGQHLTTLLDGIQPDPTDTNRSQDFYQHCDDQVQQYMSAARQKARDSVRARVSSVGWEAVKDALGRASPEKSLWL